MSASVESLSVLTSQLAMLERDIFTDQVYYAALCSIVFYELIINLKREIRYIWKSDWTIVKILYLIVRYSGVFHSIVDVCLLLYAFFGSWTSVTCEHFVAWESALPVIGVVASHLTLLIQCHAVWNRSKAILIVVSPFVVLETIVMLVLTFVKIESVPVLSPVGPCLPRATSTFCILYFIMPMLFDLIVTVLTAIKCIRLRKLNSGVEWADTNTREDSKDLTCVALLHRLGSALLNNIIQQSFQYFLIITAANLTTVLYYAINISSVESSLNGPLGIIATEVFACRLTLSLREIHKKAEPATFFDCEKKPKHFVKVVFFGDGANDTTELATLHKARPDSSAV